MRFWGRLVKWYNTYLVRLSSTCTSVLSILFTTWLQHGPKNEKNIKISIWEFFWCPNKYFKSQEKKLCSYDQYFVLKNSVCTHLILADFSTFVLFSEGKISNSIWWLPKREIQLAWNLCLNGVKKILLVSSMHHAFLQDSLRSHLSAETNRSIVRCLYQTTILNVSWWWFFNINIFFRAEGNVEHLITSKQR